MKCRQPTVGPLSPLSNPWRALPLALFSPLSNPWRATPSPASASRARPPPASASRILPAVLLFSFLLLTLLPSLHAAQAICPQCYQSSLRLTIGNYDAGSDTLNASVHADYWDPAELSTSIASSGGGPQLSEHFTLTVRPAPHAILNFTFDGEPILDAQGNVICDALSTSDVLDAARDLDVGDARCSVAYARDPSFDPVANPTAGPRKLSEWPRCGLLTARLMRSEEDNHVKPSQASAMYCPSAAPSLSLYNIFGPLLATPLFYAACLPLFIALGLLVGSMFYQGRHPFSLFDITVPRLPAMKRVRVKPPQVPYHLAYKARMSNRIISRAEKAIRAQMLALYKKGNKTGLEISNAQKAVSDTFTKAGVIATRVKANKNAAEFEANLSKLRELVQKSGADATAQNKAMGAISRMYQLREGLALDMAITAAARAGAKAGTSESTGKFGPSAKYSLSALNPRIEWLGTRIAKPWKFIPRVAKFAQSHEWMDTIPGLPYVERTAMVMQNWFGNRAGNIQMRRRLRNTAVAETLVALRLAKAPGARGEGEQGMAKFLRSNLYQFKKIGDLPRIAERLQEESRALARTIADEHLRILAEAIYLKRELNDKGQIVTKEDAAGMKTYLGILAQIQAPRDSAAWRRELVQLLLDHIQKNRLDVYNSMGQKLGDIKLQPGAAYRNEQERFTVMAKQKVLDATDELTRIENASRAQLDKANPKIINPAVEYGRYLKLVGLLDDYNADWEQGRIPMVLLGRDLADTFGRLVNEKAMAGYLKINQSADGQFANDGLRMHHIVLHMEEELRRKMRFDALTKNKDFDALKDGKYEKLTPLTKLENGRVVLNTRFNDWLQEVNKSIDPEKLRQTMQYNLRGEWAARNFLTAYTSMTDWGYSEQAERNKIDILRQHFSFQFDRGFENFFRNYHLQVDRNRMLYTSLEKLAPFYTGKDWSPETYDQWKKDGVTFGDVKKGLWMTGTERTLTPLPSGILRNADFTIKDVLLVQDPKNANRLTYDSRLLPSGVHSISTMFFNDYGDRPLNASFLFRDPRSDRWRPGTPWPSDRETAKFIQQLKETYSEMLAPQYGKLGHEAAHRERQLALENIRLIEAKLNDRVQWVLRSTLPEREDLKVGTRAVGRATQFMERVLRGGIHDTDERLNEWYASSTYARMLMDGFSRNWKDSLSDEVERSLNAKKALGDYRKEQIELLKLPGNRTLTPAEEADRQARLTEVRTQISSLARAIPGFERDARQYQKEHGKADRWTKSVADLSIPFYNVNELTVMRDPRVAFAGGHAMNPALMTGYQTGQFVGERPTMWAGHHLGPSDRLLGILARPSYMAAMAYGMSTRTFFTKLTGYQTVYHMDPEKGAHNQPYEISPIVALQSLFRPAQSFDWFTRLINPFKPMVRPLSAYRDEFGIKIKEETSWAGPRFLFPLSWKYAGAEDPFKVDDDRWAMRGIKAADELRGRNLGLSFREQYGLWGTRYAAEARSETGDAITYLRTQLDSATDREEKRILRSTLRNLQDVYETDRRSWHIPLLGNLFKQGYFSVENRAGYDISATGGSHRPWEMVGAYHKSIGKAPVPGMMWTTWDDTPHFELFPRVARAVASEAMAGPSLRAMQTRTVSEIRPEKYPGQLEGFKNLQGEEKDRRYESEFSGVGRDLDQTSILDVYRREKPLIANYMDLETDRMHYTVYNTGFILPISPLLMTGYQIWRKSKYGRAQSWVIDPMRERDYGPLTEAEQAQTADMHALRTERGRGGHPTYACPTHGIHLSVGQPCPLCRSTVAYEQDKTLRAWEGKGKYIKEGLKNWAQAAVPGLGYLHYYNQAHCRNHGVAYDRGTVCPICLSQQVERTTKEQGGHGAEQMLAADARVRELTREIEVEGKRKVRSEQEKKEQKDKIDELVRAREAELNSHLGQVEHDRRMGYKESYLYIKKVMKDMSTIDEEYKKNGFFS